MIGPCCPSNWRSSSLQSGSSHHSDTAGWLHVFRFNVWLPVIRPCCWVGANQSCGGLKRQGLGNDKCLCALMLHKSSREQVHCCSLWYGCLGCHLGKCQWEAKDWKSRSFVSKLLHWLLRGGCCLALQQVWTEQMQEGGFCWCSLEGYEHIDCLRCGRNTSVSKMN